MTTHDQMLRKQFERELAAEQAIDPAVLCCTAEGAYADARIQQAPSLAFWANIRQLEAGDPQLAWKLLSQQIERIVLRAQKHFANAPDSQAKGLLTSFKVHSR